MLCGLRLLSALTGDARQSSSGVPVSALTGHDLNIHHTAFLLWRVYKVGSIGNCQLFPKDKGKIVCVLN
jgi:hypothetical protein